jgi:hypothetical protein
VTRIGVVRLDFFIRVSSVFDLWPVFLASLFFVSFDSFVVKSSPLKKNPTADYADTRGWAVHLASYLSAHIREICGSSS